MRTFKIALVQMTSDREVEPNIETASRMIRDARGAGAELILTPENTGMIEPHRKLILEKAREESTTRRSPPFARSRRRPAPGS